VGGVLGAAEDIANWYTDWRLASDIFNSVNEFAGTIPKGQEVDALLVVDPITKRVLAVVDKDVGSITKPTTDIRPIKVTGTKQIEIERPMEVKEKEK